MHQQNRRTSAPARIRRGLPCEPLGIPLHVSDSPALFSSDDPEWIVLRQNSTGPGELPQLERVDLAHGHRATAACATSKLGSTMTANPRLSPLYGATMRHR